MAVDFLGTLQSYGGKFTVKSTQNVNTEGVKSIKVIQSEFGPQMMFTMLNGRTKYAKLSNQSTLQEGDMVNPESIKLVTLERDGEIAQRVDGEKL